MNNRLRVKLNLQTTGLQPAKRLCRRAMSVDERQSFSRASVTDTDENIKTLVETNAALKDDVIATNHLILAKVEELAKMKELLFEERLLSATRESQNQELQTELDQMKQELLQLKAVPMVEDLIDLQGNEANGMYYSHINTSWSDLLQTNFDWQSISRESSRGSSAEC